GKRFGFVRFEDVADTQQLLKKVEDTWIGTYKIRANLPKFKRGDAQRATHKDTGDLGDTVVRTKNPIPNRIDNFSSYKEVVVGEDIRAINRKKAADEAIQKRARRRLTDEEYRSGILEVQTDPDMFKKLQQCYVGYLNHIEEAENFQVSLWMEGYQRIKASSLGLDLVLLTSPEDGEIESAVAKNRSWWEKWFSTVKPWRPDLLPKGRRLWVRLFGVPLHIWGWE
ncbi:hypothetical protein A2U01_0036102, partial [Trifolium medium]|nr:hypothetical protein [Trifolium medium]